MNKSNVRLVSGSSGKGLAANIAGLLGVELIKAEVGSFGDSESAVRLMQPLKNQYVYLVQKLNRPVNDHLVELLIMVDALKRASAAGITVVLPYLAYSRQDRQDKTGEPVSAELVAKLLAAAGVDGLITIDSHSPAVKKFYDFGFEEITNAELFTQTIDATFGNKNTIVMAPDDGSLDKAKSVAVKIGVSIGSVSKERLSGTQTRALRVTGDVAGKKIILIDDIVASSNTIVNAAEAIKKMGGKNITALVSHGIFTADAYKNIKHSSIEKLYVSDSLNFDVPENLNDTISVVSCAIVLAEKIDKLHSKTN